MDGASFDFLARALAIHTRRRAVAGTLAGGALAALLDRHVQEATAKKRKRRKKKKPSGCTLSCFNKVCGQGDGCGGTCNACPGGQTCQGNQCVPDACDPPCRGAHFCQNGNCVCPPGMESCDINFCGECCSDADCPRLNPYPIPPFYLCLYENDNTTHCECFPRPGELCVQ